MSDFTFYFGATNGQTKGALKRLDEPNVMLNYASYNGTPWDNIESLFIDSGGYSFIKGMGEYETTHQEYLDWVADTDADLFALRDYPCEPDVLDAHDRTVGEHQRMTTNDHIELMDLYDDMGAFSQPLAVVQGRSVSEYQSHVQELKDHGVLTDYIGVGSVCGRHAVREIKPIVKAVDCATPPGTKIHGFGIKIPSLEEPEVYNRLSSADSMAYSYKARTDSRERGIMCGFRQHALHYLELRRDVLTIKERHNNTQNTLANYDSVVVEP